MEDETLKTAPPGLSDVPLESALDALLCDYLDRLDVLFQAYSSKNTGADAGPSISTESQCLKLHDEALERRYLVGLFESGLHVGGPARTRIHEDAEQTDQRDLVSLPVILEFNQEEMDLWRRWRPEVDETVLVYLSPERGYWPGKVSRAESGRRAWMLSIPHLPSSSENANRPDLTSA
jgi:hypothetical protein